MHNNSNMRNDSVPGITLYHKHRMFHETPRTQQPHNESWLKYYTDVIMGAMASQITRLTIVYPTVYTDADQRKHQSSVSLAFVPPVTGGAQRPSWLQVMATFTMTRLNALAQALTKLKPQWKWIHAKFYPFSKFRGLMPENAPFFLIPRTPASHWKNTPQFAKMVTIQPLLHDQFILLGIDQ